MLYPLSWLVLGSAAAIGLASEQDSDEHSEWDLFSPEWDQFLLESGDIPPEWDLFSPEWEAHIAELTSQQMEDDLIHQQRNDLQKRVDELRDEMAQKSGENRRQEMMIRSLETSVRRHQKAIEEDTNAIANVCDELFKVIPLIEVKQHLLHDTQQRLDEFNLDYNDKLKQQKRALRKQYQSEVGSIDAKMSEKDREITQLEQALKDAEKRRYYSEADRIRRNVGNRKYDSIMEEAELDMNREKVDQMWQPTIEDYETRVQSPQFRAAEEYTRMMQANQAGLSVDREIGVKIFDQILKDYGIQNAVFFDSEVPSMRGMKDDFTHLPSLSDARNQGFVLSLHNYDDPAKAHADRMAMQACINQNIPHPKLDDVRRNLAIAHGLGNNWHRIKMISVSEGSNMYKYTVDDLNDVTFSSQALKKQFKDFKSAKIHPLLYRPSFDINDFDSEGDRNFGSGSTSFDIGPSGLKKRYTQPKGWDRYGLRVVGRYENDLWLKPFENNSNQWWKAFHGTAQASKHGIDSADAMSNIYHQGFMASEHGKQLKSGTSAAVYGTGVYCATSPDDAYYATVTLDLSWGARTFDYAIMCAVKPSYSGVDVVNGGKWWVVQDKKDIRPYGIVVRDHDNRSGSSGSGCVIQ